MKKLKHIWNDPVWSKVIASFITLIPTTIIQTIITSSTKQTTFWETLASLIHSQNFILKLIIVFLFFYIVIDKIALVRTRKKAEHLHLTNTQNNKRVEGCYSWDDIHQGVICLNEKMKDEGYIPSLIVGIGRGGAIISALLSGNLIKDKHIPLIVLEREYQEVNSNKKAILFETVTFQKNLEKVLLVASDVFTGKTATTFIDYLKFLGATDIKFLVFTKVNSTNLEPDFYFESTNNTELKFPWMLSDNYCKDARTTDNSIAKNTAAR